MRIRANIAGVLRRSRYQSFPLTKAILELLDNSVDAGATRIDIKEVNGDLIIEDNGRGFDDIFAGLIIGESNKEDSIGRYGVGLKDATIKFSDTTTIESRGKRVSAPWTEIITGDHNGDIDDESIADDGLTRVILEGYQCLRSTQAIKNDEIKRTYLPLLEDSQLIISICGEVLRPIGLPQFTELLEEEFEYRGKQVRLTGGAFKSDDPMRQVWAGYNPYYKGRLLGPGRITSHGVGESGCTTFCFMLHLSDREESWELATNKDSVSDLEALLEHCYDTYTADLLKRSVEAGREIELKEIEQSITDKLNGKGNQRRKRERGKPPVKPTGTGSPHQTTHTADADGDYDDPDGENRRKKFHFKLQPLSGSTLGAVQPSGRLIVITGNLNNAFVKEHQSNEPALLCFAHMAYSMHSTFAKVDTVPDELLSDVLSSVGVELQWPLV